MSEFNPQSDLSLQAFRYAAGELTGAEAADFESLLETDLDAQLSLVQAVQLAAALQSAARAIQPAARVSPSGVRTPSRRWSPALALIGSGIVAATLLVALREESDPVGPENTTVTLWSELHDEVAESMPLDDASLEALDAEVIDEDLVPDWMLAAVAINEDAGASQDTAPGDESPEIDDET